MTLRPARLLADKIQAELAPMCERIAIAGSIRRACPEINDIDLVILPLAGQLQAIKARCLRKCLPAIDGPQNFICRFPPTGPFRGLRLDIFFAHPEQRDLLSVIPSNWGSLLLCRTGSKEHNARLCSRALSMGLKWSPYRGLLGPATPGGEPDQVIASATEEDILAALGLEWIPPVVR